MVVFHCRVWYLKRHVVVSNALIEIVRRGGSLRALLLRAARHRDWTARGGGVLAATFGRVAAAATEQHQIIAHDFSEVLLLSVLFVAARLQTALDVNLLALLQVVGNILRAPDGAVVPVRLFLPLAGLLIFPAAIGGDGERGLRYTAGRELGFGVFAQMTQQDDFVDASGCHITQNCNTWPWRPRLLMRADHFVLAEAGQEAAIERASSFGKYGDTVPSDRSRFCRAVAHEPEATAAK